MQILFITANRVGDAVLTTGVLAWLIERYPGAQITVACGPYAADLFRAVPGLERLIVMKKQSWNRHWLKLWQACRGTQWDLIVDFRDSVVSRLLSARQRAYRQHGTGQHKVIENAAILNITPPPAPKLWLDDRAENRAAMLLPMGGTFLALGPAANWTAKQWPAERFAEMARRMIAPGGALAGASVMALGEERDRFVLNVVRDALPEGRCVTVIGEDLLTVAACLKRAQVFIGNDSGLMHIAAAAGVPTLGLFGPGYEDIYGPWGEKAGYVRTTESRESLLQRLPAKGAPIPNLMGGLGVYRVIEAATGLLGKDR